MIAIWVGLGVFVLVIGYGVLRARRDRLAGRPRRGSPWRH